MIICKVLFCHNLSEQTIEITNFKITVIVLKYYNKFQKKSWLLLNQLDWSFSIKIEMGLWYNKTKQFS